jgi:membrane protease YdiL (CAAX protease family)
MIAFYNQSKHKTIIKGLALTLVLLTIFTLSSKFLPGFASSNLSINTRMLITRVVFWLIFAVIYWYVAENEKQPFIVWPEQSYSVGYYILSVIIILIVIVVGTAVIILPLKAAGLLKYSHFLGLIKSISVPVKLLTIITAGFLEEFIFRGYMIPRLKLFFKSEHPPIIISAIIFGLGHVGFGTLINVLIPMLIGLVFGYHYYKYRNLKILIICHLLIDLNAMFTPMVAKH